MMPKMKDGHYGVTALSQYLKNKLTITLKMNCMKVYNSIPISSLYIHVYNHIDEIGNYGYHYNVTPQPSCVAIFKIKYK